ncbi:defective chorion-1 protein, FC125 isoform isoform X2 [Drosophila subpulchrella]|uniref:defective chorion-1 protein, FC125 isoform isoform X2 n=1 Tax=Drosophila subpulchrella TaxID=1486046 RepID=UPI0018A13C14|nr:defective chorion-1 protein, FC125 isoform isoform X2 [Drosophila subpulchrella]
MRLHSLLPLLALLVAQAAGQDPPSNAGSTTNSSTDSRPRIPTNDEILGQMPPISPIRTGNPQMDAFYMMFPALGSLLRWGSLFPAYSFLGAMPDNLQPSAAASKVVLVLAEDATAKTRIARQNQAPNPLGQLMNWPQDFQMPAMPDFGPQVGSFFAQLPTLPSMPSLLGATAPVPAPAADPAPPAPAPAADPPASAAADTVAQQPILSQAALQNAFSFLNPANFDASNILGQGIPQLPPLPQLSQSAPQLPPPNMDFVAQMQRQFFPQQTAGTDAQASDISEVRVRPEVSYSPEAQMAQQKINAALEKEQDQERVPLLWFRMPSTQGQDAAEEKTLDDLRVEAKLRAFEHQVIAELKMLQKIELLAKQMRSSAAAQSGDSPNRVSYPLSRTPVHKITRADIEQALRDDYVRRLVNKEAQRKVRNQPGHTNQRANGLKRQAMPQQTLSKEDIVQIMAYAYRMANEQMEGEKGKQDKMYAAYRNSEGQRANQQAQEQRQWSEDQDKIQQNEQQRQVGQDSQMTQMMQQQRQWSEDQGKIQQNEQQRQMMQNPRMIEPMQQQRQNEQQRQVGQDSQMIQTMQQQRQNEQQRQVGQDSQMTQMMQQQRQNEQQRQVGQDSQMIQTMQQQRQNEQQRQVGQDSQMTQMMQQQRQWSEDQDKIQQNEQQRQMMQNPRMIEPMQQQRQNEQQRQVGQDSQMTQMMQQQRQNEQQRQVGQDSQMIQTMQQQRQNEQQRQVGQDSQITQTMQQQRQWSEDQAQAEGMTQQNPTMMQQRHWVEDPQVVQQMQQRQWIEDEARMQQRQMMQQQRQWSEEQAQLNAMMMMQQMQQRQLSEDQAKIEQQRQMMEEDPAMMKQLQWAQENPQSDQQPSMMMQQPRMEQTPMMMEQVGRNDDPMDAIVGEAGPQMKENEGTARHKVDFLGIGGNKRKKFKSSPPTVINYYYPAPVQRPAAQGYGSSYGTSYGGGGYGSNAYGVPQPSISYRAAVGNDEVDAMLRQHQTMGRTINAIQQPSQVGGSERQKSSSNPPLATTPAPQEQPQSQPQEHRVQKSSSSAPSETEIENANAPSSDPQVGSIYTYGEGLLHPFMGLLPVDRPDDPWNRKPYDPQHPLYTGGGSYAAYLKDGRHRRDTHIMGQGSENGILTPGMLERLLRIKVDFQRRFPHLYQGMLNHHTNLTRVEVQPPVLGEVTKPKVKVREEDETDEPVFELGAAERSLFEDEANDPLENEPEPEPDEEDDRDVEEPKESDEPRDISSSRKYRDDNDIDYFSFDDDDVDDSTFFYKANKNKY